MTSRQASVSVSKSRRPQAAGGRQDTHATMTAGSIMKDLERLGSEQQRKIYRNHGAQGDLFGVKIGDLKPIAKKIKGQQALALELFATGNLDAMYLAGLVADGAQMSEAELDGWAKQAWCTMLSEYTVPWVAAESPRARELALEWIASPAESVAATGWNTYAGIVSLQADSELDLEEIRGLLERVERQIDSVPNRVRYCMNGFVIAVGVSVKPLLRAARATAKRFGTVPADMGETACKIPSALETIDKVESMGRLGLKRKTMKC